MQHLAVAGIARLADGDAVPDVEAGEEGQHAGRRRAGGHRHPGRIDLEVIATPIQRGDSPAQGIDPVGVGVAQRICAVERGVGGGEGGRRQARRRLADLQVQDLVSGRSVFPGGPDHLHHVEGIDLGSLRRAHVGPVQRASSTEEPCPNKPWLAVMPTFAFGTCRPSA